MSKQEKKNGFAHESTALAVPVEWYTPAWVFEGMGLRFDLDPCAPTGGLPWIPANRFLSLPQDGLAEEWTGLVWCNPPYGNKTALWLSKLACHGNGVALVFARTDVKWFVESMRSATTVLFLPKRVAFVDGTGKSGGGGAGAGSMLLAWGDAGADGLVRLQEKVGGVLLTSWEVK